MCGRFALTNDLNEILKAFHINRNEYEGYDKRFNIPPTTEIPAVIAADDKRVLRGFKWGLIPFWSKDGKSSYSMINARAETIQKKPAYRNLLDRRRVIIPSSGYFEWKKIGSEKQPYLFQLKSGTPFGLAGLYDTWRSPEDETVWSCTIIATEPNEVAKKVHDRMPVILDESGMDTWLDPAMMDKDVLTSLLMPFPADKMRSFPVSKAVNNVKNQGEELIKEVVINSK
ncbi:SOS response-associated peptidase [Paenibacillus sp. CC-CFT747]|nr:SOS response-associated peptidase [Paenibacillus sp. CC-CFT747]